MRSRWLIPAVASMIFVATIVMWVRSYGILDYPQIDLNGSGVGVYSLKGRARLSYYQGSTNPRQRIVWAVLHAGSDPPPGRVLGFGIDSGGAGGWRYYGATVPYWFFALVWAGATIISTRRTLRQRNREHDGLCQVCGYDLRASSDRCPECGTPLAGARTITPA